MTYEEFSNLSKGTPIRLNERVLNHVLNGDEYKDKEFTDWDFSQTMKTWINIYGYDCIGRRIVKNIYGRLSAYYGGIEVFMPKLGKVSLVL